MAAANVPANTPEIIPLGVPTPTAQRESAHHDRASPGLAVSDFKTRIGDDASLVRCASMCVHFLSEVGGTSDHENAIVTLLELVHERLQERHDEVNDLADVLLAGGEVR